MLIVFGGLPGTGKSTLARRLAQHLGATWLRIDSIEQAILAAGVPADAVGPAGYVVAQALAAENLRLGHAVVADAVNPVAESRAGWRDVAAACAVRLLEIELVCSDRAEHRRRVEARVADIPGHALPSWEEVARRDYAPWPEPHLLLDTARLDPEAALAAIAARLGPTG